MIKYYIFKKSFTFYYMMAEDKNIVTFEQMQSFQNNESVMIIDVRTFDEIERTGKIGGSIIIPVDSLEETLKNFKEKFFKQKYGRTIPDKNFPLIFTCRTGRRATEAAEIACKLNFTNVRVYVGGWTEWEERIGN